MGRTPCSPQSSKQDTMGVGFYLNCPDRSWCVAQVGQHKKSGDTDQAGTNPHNASQGMQEQKGKREEASKKGNRGMDPREKAGPPSDGKPYRYRARLRSTPWRSARSAL